MWTRPVIIFLLPFLPPSYPSDSFPSPTPSSSTNSHFLFLLPLLTRLKLQPLPPSPLPGAKNGRYPFKGLKLLVFHISAEHQSFPRLRLSMIDPFLSASPCRLISIPVPIARHCVRARLVSRRYCRGFSSPFGYETSTCALEKASSSRKLTSW
jgi:hypothetical protein